MSIDPVTFMDTGVSAQFNRYSYTANDPINWTDPNGECPWCVALAVIYIADKAYGAYDAAQTAKAVANGEKSVASAAVEQGAGQLGGLLGGPVGRFIGKRGGKKLNLGSGSNPKPDAINVDIQNGAGVDVVADANALPFANGTFDEISAINPSGFNPVNPESARVLAPSGTINVTGTAKNPNIIPPSASELNSMGLEVVGSGPLSNAHKFGTQRMTDGRKLNTQSSTTTTYRKVE